MIIGITGGSGSGKTSLLNLIAAQGGTVLDCDAIYHELLQRDTSLLSAIEAHFPGVVESNMLDRKKLGNIVFNDKDALKKLNEITHAAVKEAVLRRLEAGPALAAIDAIGLFEGDLASICDVTVAVLAPTQMRIARLTAREGISEDYARSRIAAQPDEDWYRSQCTYALENDSTLASFQEKCIAFLHNLGIIKEKPKGE